MGSRPPRLKAAKRGGLEEILLCRGALKKFPGEAVGPLEDLGLMAPKLGCQLLGHGQGAISRGSVCLRDPRMP